MTTNRANPFENLSDFDVKPQAPKPKPVEKAQIEQLAQENGFPSRPAHPASTQPRRPGRRYTTGRNQQLNIKATAATIERVYRIADQERIPLGALLERALDALERPKTSGA